MSNFMPDTSELVRERDDLSSLITRIDEVVKKVDNEKGLEHLIECVLQTGPLDLSDAFRIARCFGFKSSNDVKFAAYRLIRLGKAKFGPHMELELIP